MKAKTSIRESLSSAQQIAKELKRYKFAMLILLGVIALLSIALMINTQSRFVIVQGYNGTKYKVYMHRVDPRFLLSKTLGYSHAFFDITPSTVGVSDGIFLSYLSPRAYSKLKPQLLDREKAIKHNAQTQFFVPELGGVINAKNNVVTIKGMLHRIIASKELEPQAVKVRASYDVDYGQVQLSGWSVEDV